VDPSFIEIRTMILFRIDVDVTVIFRKPLPKP
jgi:hypothetical protein